MKGYVGSAKITYSLPSSGSVQAQMSFISPLPTWLPHDREQVDVAAWVVGPAVVGRAVHRETAPSSTAKPDDKAEAVPRRVLVSTAGCFSVKARLSNEEEVPANHDRGGVVAVQSTVQLASSQILKRQEHVTHAHESIPSTSSGQPWSSTVMVWEADVELPQPSVAVKTRTICKVQAWPPTMSTRPSPWPPQASCADADSKGKSPSSQPMVKSEGTKTNSGASTST